MSRRAAAAPPPPPLASPPSFAHEIAVFKSVRFAPFQLASPEVDAALCALLSLPDPPADSPSPAPGGAAELAALLEARLALGPKGEWAERPRILRALRKLCPAAYACFAYTRMRQADLLAACPSLSLRDGRLLVAPRRAPLPAAPALRELVAALRPMLPQDAELLPQLCGGAPLEQVLAALYLHHVADVAAQTLAAALPPAAGEPPPDASRSSDHSQHSGGHPSARRPWLCAPPRRASRLAAESGRGGSARAAGGGGGACVDWPPLLREASAVCDTLCRLASELKEAWPVLFTPGPPPPPRLGMGRRAALEPFAHELADAVRAHVQQLFTLGIEMDVRDGVGREQWKATHCVSGQGTVLGSVATILTSLRLHAGGAASGVLPQLDVTLAAELRHGAALLSSHFEALTSSRPAAPLLLACLASALALAEWLRQLRRGEARGAAGPWVPPTKWADEALGALQQAAGCLEGAAARLAEKLCAAYVAAGGACARAECADEAAWRAPRAWRQDARCSHGVQAVGFVLRGCHADLQSLGDQSTASLLFTSILARSATELLRLYAPLRPSAARAPQLHRDLRFLLAFFRAHLPPPRPPPPAAARAEEHAHAAVRALLSLLALHAAPLAALLPPLRAAAAAAAAGGAAEAWGEAALEAVGGGGAAEEEACAALALPALAPHGGGAYDPLQQHLRLQAAAEAAWPADVAWGALLREENFPLARLPRLVLAAVANRPDVAAEAEPMAASDGDAAEVRRLLAAVAERREGGAQLSAERAAER